MSVIHTNFRGDVYYLYSRKTSKGNTAYTFSKKIDGDIVSRLPDGYEIYENPNGKVYLRKTVKKLILAEEIKTIESGMEKYCPIKDFKLDSKKDMVYIYTNSSPIHEMEEPSPFLTLDKYKEYETVMRFKLVSEADRTFVVERFCFFDDLDDWIELDESSNIQKLVEEYVQHIGQDTFYDLY